MPNRNSPEMIKSWMEKALLQSDITIDEYHLLKEEGMKIIDSGGWRGDVSEKWRRMGYGPDRIRDMYL